MQTDPERPTRAPPPTHTQKILNTHKNLSQVVIALYSRLAGVCLPQLELLLGRVLLRVAGGCCGSICLRLLLFALRCVAPLEAFSRWQKQDSAV